MNIKFHELGQIEDLKIQSAVIVAKYKNEWILLRFKDKETYELPVGLRKDNEDINNTASRQLFSSICALNYNIKPICLYELENNTFGQIFYSAVKELDKLNNSLIKERITSLHLEEELAADYIKEMIEKVENSI